MNTERRVTYVPHNTLHQQKNDNLMQAVFIWSLGIIHFVLATAEIPFVVDLRQTPSSGLVLIQTCVK